ncbi:MAG TPA: DUF883 C-terminal domain-containing protein [Thermoanaerobaculia bacterium]
MDQQKNPTETVAAPPPASEAAAAQSRAGRAKEFVSEKYSAASDAVKNKYTAVRQKVDETDFAEMTDKVREYVRSNPGKALLISVGVGFVIGLMLRRGRDDE